MRLESIYLALNLTKYYKSIKELPISIWSDIRQTGNVSLLIKKGKLSKGRLIKLWVGLQDEYLANFGAGESYQRFMELRYKRAVLMAKFLETKDMNYRQQILFLDKDIEIESKNFEGGAEFEETYGWLIDEMKVSIPLNKTTVYEFYSMLNFKIKQVKNRK